MLATRRYNLRAEPENPSGAPLDVLLEIIAPEATTNLFTNPSWETNTSGWTNTNDGSGGTPYQRATARQFKGAYSAQMTIRPTGGTYNQIVNSSSLSSSTHYSMQFHVRRSNGGAVQPANCKAYVNGAVTDWDTIAYIGGGWYRVEKTWLSTGTGGVGIRLIGSPGQVFYVDAAQLETKGYCTTYCDGDQPGLLPVESPPAYYWTGTPHASTSVRSATTRAGGRPMNVARYGLTVLALIGLGLSQRSVIATPLGLSDGSLYQRTIRESRVFTVAGSFEGAGPRDLSAKRGALRSLLSHDLSGLDQPAVLRLQRLDQGEPMGDQVTLAASYLEGLGEEMTQPFSEEASIQFQQFLPALQAPGDRGVSLGVQASVSNANYIIQRNAAGTWSALGTGANAQVRAVAITPDGSLYAAGDFTSIGGTAANRIARWNGSSWSALGTGANDNITSLAVGPDGSLYAGGEFTAAGGVANTAYIARWDGSNWSALGTGMNNPVFALAFGPDGSLYAGGSFTTAGGGGANRIARWNGSAWSALGTGAPSGTVLALIVGPDGLLYAGGNFPSVGGVADTAYIARWNGSAWFSVGGGANNLIYALAFSPAGMLYAGGNFTTIGGQSIGYIAAWNGAAWSDLGANMTGSIVFATAFSPAGQLHIGGTTFSAVGGVTMPDNAALWTGSAWAPIPVDLPGTASVNAFLFATNGTLTIAYNTSGTATAASVTSVANPGTVPAGLKATITGPTSGSARVYSLVNTTTGRAIYFDLTLLSGETAYLTVADGLISLRTSFRGPLNSAILPASDADFALVKGANSLSFFAAGSTMTAVLAFTPQYESLDDATLTPALQ